MDDPLVIAGSLLTVVLLVLPAWRPDPPAAGIGTMEQARERRAEDFPDDEIPGGMLDEAGSAEPGAFNPLVGRLSRMASARGPGGGLALHVRAIRPEPRRLAPDLGRHQTPVARAGAGKAGPMNPDGPPAFSVRPKNERSRFTILTVTLTKVRVHTLRPCKSCAAAGIWIPAFAGMTKTLCKVFKNKQIIFGQTLREKMTDFSDDAGQEI